VDDSNGISDKSHGTYCCWIVASVDLQYYVLHVIVGTRLSLTWPYLCCFW